MEMRKLNLEPYQPEETKLKHIKSFKNIDLWLSDVEVFAVVLVDAEALEYLRGLAEIVEAIVSVCPVEE